MDSENVEGLCFPLLFPHGEPGYTNASKSGMSPDEYAMARLMMPEKLGHDFMTAQAPYAPIEFIDSRTGEAFAPTEDHLLATSLISHLAKLLPGIGKEGTIIH
jgi:hypothetical protein